MAESKAIERHTTKMVVLGGRFQLGDLYDYRSDSTLTDGSQCWESTDVASATRVDNQFKLKLKLSYSETTSNKWENMGLDDHLKATVLASLVNKYRGACHYLNDQPKPGQATRILICRAKSGKERLDLQILTKEDVPLRFVSEERKSLKAGSVPTHVVVGITYGAEAYCVLTQDLNDSDEADDEDREEVEEKLLEIARKMEEALGDKQDAKEFAEQFDKEEKKQLTRMKCRFYADLQSSAVRECNAFDAYKYCLKLIEQVQKTDIENSKSVPIAVLLCPLKFITGKTGVLLEYEDVDVDLITRCAQICDELERVSTKINTVRKESKKGSHRSLRLFEDAVSKYKELVKKSLKNAIVKARETCEEDEIEKIAEIAETHPLFKPARLERWLRYKHSESEMADKLNGVSGITFIANQKLLVEELSESLDKKYALVLSVPPLDEKTNEILMTMKDYLHSMKLVSVERDDDDTDQDVEGDVNNDKAPWHLIQRKRKQILAKIRDLADHIEKNKHLADRVQFCITYGEVGKGIISRYFIYEAGNLLQGNLVRLPGPPTNLRIAEIQNKTIKTTIRIDWNYEDLAFPCSFIVEYQLIDCSDGSWTQQKTEKAGESHVILHLKNVSTMKFRVAADTCIGRSEFSEVIEMAVASANVDDTTVPKSENGEVPIECEDVDNDLIARCTRICDELEQFITKINTVRKESKKGNQRSLRQFEDAVSKYKELVKKSLKNAVEKARVTGEEGEIEKIAEIIETHPLFKPASLEQWLQYKQAEFEMADKLNGVKGVTFFASQKLLVDKLEDSFDKIYALVLSIPKLDEKTNEILTAMQDYADYTKLTSVERDDDDTDEDVEDVDDKQVPWHMIQGKRKQVLTKIRELVDHVTKNKHLVDQVHFCIACRENVKLIKCQYSIYEAGNLLQSNLDRLPGPPTNLRIEQIPENRNRMKMPSSSIRLEWDYEDLELPCSFIVEYQLNNSSDDSWTQKKTAKPGENHLTLNLKNVLAMKFRVAADTCIGRSEFSEIIDAGEALADEEEEGATISESEYSRNEIPVTEKHFQSVNQITNVLPSFQPPSEIEVELVTQSTAEIGWKTSSSVGNQRYTYCIRYWKNGQDPSLANELCIPINETSCRLDKLLPETTYCVNIVVFTEDGREIIGHSNTVNLTTLANKVRFAETILSRCKNIGKNNGIELYAVPLTPISGSRSTAERFAFGKADMRNKNGANALNSGRMQHRTILVMGATGAGKTTLINGMINYIFNVEWEDTFRFQLIQEQTAGRSQVDSQTSRITAYNIHHAEGFRVPYSLTIVDTPGYGDTKGLERDQEITEMVRKFFEDKNGIQELDVIGFVAQASLPRLTPTQIYIFDSVLSIFGNDVKENINFLLTFADSQVPPVLSAIAQADLPCPIDAKTGEPLHHKFNNSGFFCSSRESAGNTVDKFNRFFWRLGMENFQKFFSVLATMKTKSLSLTKQVLEERKQLETTVDGLQPLIKIGLSKMEEMRKTKQMITNSQAQIEANENVEFEVEVTVPKKIEIPPGQYLTNCNKCYITCHNPCSFKNDEDKVKCAAMDCTMPEATRSCRICPEKCIWNMHANQPYRWEYVIEKQATSSDAIKQKYETELKRKLTAEELIKVLEKDVEDNNTVVLQRIETVSRCIKKLDEIALRPNPFSTPQYIDLIIDAEQQEKRLGFKERIESLKRLRQMAVITSKIKNQEPLLSMDRKDDLDGQTSDDYDCEDNYSNAETAIADDDDNNDSASMTSPKTNRHKFLNSFK